MTRYIDDVATVYITASQFSTGASFDATGSPAYRIYEGTTDTPIQTGSFAPLDDANTTGLYAFSTTLSAANGYEVGKTYLVYATATVDGVAAHTKAAEFVVRANPALESVLTTIATQVALIYKLLWNRMTKVGSTITLYDDDNTSVLATSNYARTNNGRDYDKSRFT